MKNDLRVLLSDDYNDDKQLFQVFLLMFTLKYVFAEYMIFQYTRAIHSFSIIYMAQLYFPNISMYYLTYNRYKARFGMRYIYDVSDTMRLHNNLIG